MVDQPKPRSTRGVLNELQAAGVAKDSPLPLITAGSNSLEAAFLTSLDSSNPIPGELGPTLDMPAFVIRAGAPSKFLKTPLTMFTGFLKTREPIQRSDVGVGLTRISSSSAKPCSELSLGLGPTFNM